MNCLIKKIVSMCEKCFEESEMGQGEQIAHLDVRKPALQRGI